MTRKKIECDLRVLIAELCRCDPQEINAGDDLVEKFGLDSLGALRVLAGIEKRFEMRFPDDTLSRLRTIEILAAAVENARGDQP
jgi:acyl carrier protein